MKAYHQYIYDGQGRRIIGDFESAYRECDDVWPSQHNVDRMKYQWPTWALRQKGPGARLLDIGAGYGDYLARLAGQGLSAWGIEISPSAVAKGRRRFGGQLPLLVGDVRCGLPFADRSFDVVVVFGVLWFLLDDIDACLAEVVRVLRPGGSAFFSLVMCEDPIGKEILGSYHDMIELLRRRFTVREAVLGHDSAALAQGRPLAECFTEMTARCVPPGDETPEARDG